MSKDQPVDEEAVLAALAKLRTSDNARILAPEHIKDIVIEGRWIAVVLDRQESSGAFAAFVHQHLAEVLPGSSVEIRVGSHIFRGGSGFGKERHVIAVLGGKGGVGKSTTAVNLALTLSAMGRTVGVLDGDLNAPDIPHMLRIQPGRLADKPDWRLWSTHVTPPSQWLRPQERLGLEVMSIGFVVPEPYPPAVTGRVLISALLRHLIFEVAWTVDVLLIDAPPGTGDELQVMAGELPLSGAIFVTTPQDLAQMDAERTLTLLTEHRVPVIGVVQNMASLACPHCGQGIDMFAESSRLVNAGIGVLGRIPFDVRLSTSVDQGTPLVLADPRGSVAHEFARIANAVHHWLSDRSETSH